MEARPNTLIRPAVPADAHQIARLMHYHAHLHRHLDWHTPLDWLGFPPFLVMEHQGKVVAALACPPGPPRVAWLRFFVHDASIPLHKAWKELWKAACAEMSREGNYLVVAIALHPWLTELLEASGFSTSQSITTLQRESPFNAEIPLPERLSIRPMTYDDLEAVAEVDALAFESIWQNPLPTLSRAFRKACFATIAERSGMLVGYQLSTRSSYSLHLGRLAVRPEAQQQGIGSALVMDLFCRAGSGDLRRITVNTQSDNLASLRLYQHLGFHQTGEQYPVYKYPVSKQD